MARPSKPVAVLKQENKSHRTKAELEQREKAEAAMLSGKKCFERESVRANPIAHKEFCRVVELMRAIGKDDALYAPEYNRYAEIYAEEEFYKSAISDIQREMTTLHKLSETVENAAAALAESVADTNVGNIGDEAAGETVAELLKLCDSLLEKRGKLFRQLSEADSKVKQKRDALFALERENCMSVSAALRTIPKDAQSKEDDDELIKALRGD